MIIRVETTASTMIDAAELAARGEPHGTVVVAERQTAGIGRHGHSWHSEAGAGLYLSIVLRLGIAPADMPALTMALGLAVQAAVNDVAGVAADLRWPNDVMLNERKLAGIMVQAAAGDALIAGIGVNVNQMRFPEELASIATSLRMETGAQFAKDDILNRVIAEALRYASLLVAGGRQEIFRRFERCSTWVRDREVTVEVDNRVIRGRTAGLDANGFLQVATPEGTETIIAGGVRSAA
ncbi:MAG TPA: biotin--[acetyl-CoA-carboxylase] ligase [Bryobacteraceae bacterium]|nr:biotin--[acetyl-CoA-carboxylase] ligase [Bryobacteraceae bacterium]